MLLGKYKSDTIFLNSQPLNCLGTSATTNARTKLIIFFVVNYILTNTVSISETSHLANYIFCIHLGEDN